MHLPAWTPTRALVHIGTLNPADKGRDSFEGHGLSVSECPDAWERIARLGGRTWWQLDPPAGQPAQFLDRHALDARQIGEVLQWGVAEGLCEPVTVYRVSWHDTESDERRYFTYDNESEARAEYDAQFAEYDGEVAAQGPRFESAPGSRLTSKALARLHRDQADLDETPDLLLPLYVDQCTPLDGVYWGDRLDPYALSAPRAVILPSRIPRFAAKAVAAPAPRRPRP